MIKLVILAVLLASSHAATFESYVLPHRGHVEQKVLVQPGPAVHPPKAVAYSAALNSPVPQPNIFYTDLPTEIINTGTKVTVHHEPVEQHGYIIRW